MSKTEQNRFFKILNGAADRQESADSAFQYDGLDDDKSPYGRDVFHSELNEIDATPERMATAPFLVDPDREDTEFVLVLSEVLQTSPKLIDTLSKNKMKLSSKLIPDPEADKPFRSDSTNAWEKAVRSYITKESTKRSLLARAAQARQAKRG